MSTVVSAGRLRVVQGIITTLPVTAIVNATNPLLTYLPKMGGPDSLIYRAAGPRVLEECFYLRKRRSPVILPMGQAVVTSGGNLAAKFIIHTAGPTWHDGRIREAELLRECYQNCLQLAAVRRFESVAFPSISTGIYGYPEAEAAAIAGHEIRCWLATHDYPREVLLVATNDKTRRLYNAEAARAG